MLWRDLSIVIFAFCRSIAFVHMTIVCFFNLIDLFVDVSYKQKSVDVYQLGLQVLCVEKIPLDFFMVISVA